ncbi:MAG: DnaD domain protein [Oscillospiraceae bacterium]|nr:DnaD domain protein [Oscillospiraceae bacterium]MBR6561960.1 DnaD domain protein [Oscillospiraceae bacterium]
MDRQREALQLKLPVGEVERILRAQDADAALLYLYLCSTGRVLELSAAAKSLGRSEGQIAEAAGRLRAMGAFPASANALPQPEELPEYDLEAIAARGGEDAVFRSLINEAQWMLGHLLSASELRTLFGIYDHLGLPPEVILLLLNHCAEVHAARYGEGRRPTMRAVEREAFAWVNRELMTLELAEDYIRRQDIRERGVQQVRTALGLVGRALSPTEKRYIAEWLDMGYSPEAIELAYDRTVANTGALKWKYMDSIIRSWNAKGLLTVEEILQKDKRGASGAAAAKRDGRTEPDDYQARLDRMIEHYKQDKR